jgi:hypothetical protein
VIGTTGFYEIERKDSEGNWPVHEQASTEEKISTKVSTTKKPKGSWRNRRTSDEEE